MNTSTILLMMKFMFSGDLPAGLDTEVTDGGGNLTPTDRQLASIARCVLDQPRILVMDEATSCLDSNKEARVHKFVLELLHQTTIITVAHRLNNILEYDRSQSGVRGSSESKVSHF